MAQTLEYNGAVTGVAPIPVPAFDDDLDIIQKLDDEPNDVGGLSAAELKETFDQAGNQIKTYINEELIPAVLADGLTEETRANAEAERVANEQERVANEQERERKENAREEAEQARVTETTGVVAQAQTYSESARYWADKAGQAAYGGNHAFRHAADGSDPITPAMIGAASNPNLLDNAYFGNPVDQRGGYVVPPGTPYYADTAMTSQAGTTTIYYKGNRLTGTYSEVVFSENARYVVPTSSLIRGYTGEGYTIDRWRTHGNATVTIGSDSLAFFASGDANIVQPLENALKEDTLLTFSVLNKTGTVYIRIRDTEWGDYGVSQRTGDGVVAVTRTIPKGKIPMVQIYSSQGENIAVKAAKLELGPQQTLAHQENGVWALNEIPSYAEELAKCQRYQQVFCGEGAGYAPLFNGYFHSDVSARFAIPLSVPMAKKPSIVYVNGADLISFSVRGGGTSKAMASLAISYTPNTNVVGLHAAVSGAATGNACAFTTNGARGILLDANL